MILSIQQWHERYQQQARWTKSLRKYIYDRIGFNHFTQILEVGCGTGVILEELCDITICTPFGVDINPGAISQAQFSTPSSILSIGNALDLPFQSSAFDISFCHFLLLWVKNPLQVVIEMIRVVRPGGYVLALAEPDYGGRIDYPSELAEIGNWQIKALKEQGAYPYIGRELRSLFSIAGLSEIEVGVLGGQWTSKEMEEEVDLEWEVIQSDLGKNTEFLKSAATLQALDRTSRKNQQRILFVPTFYAMGVKRS
jgi:ubiquinone/menaquinone biosynthesis C-methylase UbiE